MKREEFSPGIPAEPMTATPASPIGQVYARWRRAFLRGLGRAGGSDTPAEDALHDAVVKCMASNAPLANADETRAYLHKIVSNGMAEEARERQAGRTLRTVPLEEAQAEVESLAAADESDPYHAVAQRQRMARLQQALDELPERQREAFVLHRFDGLTQDEVARRMGISRRMVVKHLGRAMAYCEVRVHYASAEQMRLRHPPVPHADDEEEQRGDTAANPPR